MIIHCNIVSEGYQENALTPKLPEKPRQEAAALPCSNLFICWIWSTVFFRILHLSGLTLRVSMSPMFADSSSASSSKYLFSCSRRRFSLLLEKGKKLKVTLMTFSHCSVSPHLGTGQEPQNTSSGWSDDHAITQISPKYWGVYVGLCLFLCI